MRTIFYSSRNILLFLTDRYQQVSLLGFYLPLYRYVSEFPKVYSGSTVVPYNKNDIITCSSIGLLQLVLFADDTCTSAFIIGLNCVDLFQVMNEELSKLSRFFQVNKLPLNINKSNYVRFKSKYPIIWISLTVIYGSIISS